MSQKNKPLFVATSDLHFNEKNLELSSSALLSAMRKAIDLRVPLVIAGDLHDTKAIIRAEVANTIIGILESKPLSLDVYILVGNHDLINEKGEAHGLNYLRPYATIIDRPQITKIRDWVMIPYQNSVVDLEDILDEYLAFPFVICHQGIHGALMGDYIQDKTSAPPTLFKDFKTVISGHYHKHQTIGNFTYIGSPFTMSFGEANDGPKGFLVVNEDGSFTCEILNLRKHVVFDFTAPLDEGLTKFLISDSYQSDLIWFKIKGDKSELDKIDKKLLAKLLGHSNFKFDKIPTDSSPLPITKKPLTDHETLDALIDSLSDSDIQKKNLKSTWRELLS